MNAWFIKRVKVATALGCNPDDEASWPIELVERLVRLRDEQGEEAFLREIERTIHN